MLRHVDPKRHDDINAAVTGPLTSLTGSASPRVDPESGLPVPAWWSGDEDATRSATVAAAQAARR